MVTTEQHGRKRRRDAGYRKLMDRDLTALAWIGEQWTVRSDHLQHVLGRSTDTLYSPLSPAATREVVGRWVRAGWVDARKIFGTQPAWVWLTRAGLDAVGLPYRDWMPKESGLGHFHAVNAVRVWLEGEDMKTGQIKAWVSERQLRYDHGQQGFVGGGRVHVPDAVVQYDGYDIAIEVELSAKSMQRTKDIMAELVNRKTYRAVFYFVTKASKGVVQEAWERLNKPERVHIREQSTTEV